MRGRRRERRGGSRSGGRHPDPDPRPKVGRDARWSSSPLPTPDAPAPGDGERRVPRRFGALAGLLAAAVALGVAELVAGLVGPASSPVVAVGDAVITVTPEPVKNFAIRTFGENDKVALVIGTLVVVALYAMVIGVLSLRNRRLGTAGILLFGAIGAYAAATRPAGGMLDAVPSLVGAGAGIIALNALLVPLIGPRADADRAPAPRRARRAGGRPPARRPSPAGTARAERSTGGASSSPAGSPSGSPRWPAAPAS